MATRDWRFGINDPRLSGWVITAAYFVAFLLCLWAGIKSTKTAAMGAARKKTVSTGSDAGGRPGGGGLWFLFAAILFLLGANKQLDLQTLLADIGRTVSTAQGWYRNRRLAQAVFVAVFASICGLVVVLIVKKSRNRRSEYGIATAGIVLLIVVIVLRAGFMEHFDTILTGRHVRIPRRAYSITELSCIFLAGLGAFMALVRGRIRKKKEFGFDSEKE
jgi:hypothetical protein